MKKYYFVLVLMLFINHIMAQNISTYLPKSGLIAFYTFDGDANDISENKNNPTTSTIKFTEDRNGNNNGAGLFSGNEYAIVPNSPSMKIDSTFSINLWMFLNSDFPKDGWWNTKAIFSKDNDYPYGAKIFITPTGDDSLSVYFGTDTWDAKKGFGSKIHRNSLLNSWHHLVFVFKGTEGKLYMDGNLFCTQKSYPSWNSSNGLNLHIGLNGNPAGSYPYKFVGKMDELGFWNRALTETEIKSLHDGCVRETATSSNFTESIYTSSKPIDLTAQPEGGIFSGQAVQNNTFEPIKAKLGINVVKYNFKNASGCLDSTMFSVIVVDTNGTICKYTDTVTVTNNVTKYDTVLVNKTMFDTITVTNQINKYDTITIKNNVYDTITVTNNVTKYDTVIVTNNITKYDTVIVTNNVTKYDTIIIKNNVYDTITITNNITKYDTVIFTNNITKYDTITVTNNITKYDTVTVKKNIYDTVIVPKTVTKYDTITVTKNVTKFDTVTVKKNVYDTVIVPKTVTKYDTVTITKNVTKYDTVTFTNNVTKYDTLKVTKFDTITVKNNVYDTVTITNNITKYDTVKVTKYDTITFTNNVTKYDTILVNKYDTITVTNNVTKYDTITLTDTVSILKITFKLTTGIQANQLASMSLYPNPTTDVLHIEVGDAKALDGYRYRILDALGKEVYNELVKNAITEIPLKTLGAAGMYQFEVLDQKNVRIQTNKIVLQ